ncbi:porphobilinogen synthase [Aquiluna sp. KACHI24]|uniref:porphobilinogen synthase n=1 Tax=Aquiluna sp. KACHI24 TaxID=2968831 RepID=UPI0021FC5B07|nr:porphobilinogen synthase [Aquiluna sp. KACHI24]BDQ00786.1 delta-aminolevulinic acid dehydratase [Aquiluna sp. KACHI24]
MIHRPRRLRATAAIRELVAEVSLTPANLMQPIFVREGLSAPREIMGMPGVLQHTETSFLTELDRALSAGVVSVMLFAIPESRDPEGSAALDPNGILNRAVRAARAHVSDHLVIVADLCLDEFTSHGHCGVLGASGAVDNDGTLEAYGLMALELARAGADLLGASGMMDGQVGHVRKVLDQNGFDGTGILAYAAKYASTFYGPFRNAVESELTGNRKTYQQDYRNRTESIRGISLDLEQGADIVMVKPALCYLDIVSAAAGISSVPVAAYLVSGELAMIESAAANGFIDRDGAIWEALYSVRRAGAQIICTYWAIEFAQKLKG